MNRSYALGDELSFAATFSDPLTQVLGNPNNVILRLKPPSGLGEFRPAVSNPAVGRFTAVYTPLLPGIWHSRWEGTSPAGGITAAIEGSFEVRPSAFTS